MKGITRITASLPFWKVKGGQITRVTANCKLSCGQANTCWTTQTMHTFDIVVL